MHEIILQNLTKEEAEMFEIAMIKYYKTQDRKLGYNLDCGGGVNKKHSEFTKLKMRNVKLGKIFSEEHRKNISKSKTGKGIGKKRSDATKLKMSIAQKCRIISKEHAKNNGLAHKKKVMNIDTLEIFDSAKDAEIYYNVAHGAVSHACLGDYKTCLGYRWKYVDN